MRSWLCVLLEALDSYKLQEAVGTPAAALAAPSASAFVRAGGPQPPFGAPVMRGLPRSGRGPWAWA